MMKFSANLSMLFTEYDFLERFEKAHQSGFQAVEYLFPYEYPAKELRNILDNYQLKQTLFNTYPGNWSAGDKGFASRPHQEAEFEQSIIQALEYADTLGCQKIHVMSGIMNPDHSYDKHRKTFLRNLKFASDLAKKQNVILTLEPLNTRDAPHYFISHQKEAVELIHELDCDNVKLQFDFYHAQIMDGDLTTLLQTVAKDIGYVQIASVPDRHEPNDGEINYPFLLKQLSNIGYHDWIGCEYHPAQTTEEGLIWLKKYLIKETNK